MKKLTVLFSAAAVVGLLASCNHAATEGVSLSGLKRADFQAEVQGKQTDMFVLKNASGMEVCLTNYGARLLSIMVPDREGRMTDVLVGQRSMADYTTYASDFGAGIGQYANRIDQGKITLDGVEYQLPKNNYGHCLHGGCTLDGKGVGPEGVRWETPMGWQYSVHDVVEQNDSSITFQKFSPDGEAGFPGNVTATVTYTLTADNAVVILWKATTDKKTVINLCNHAYFNFNGDFSRQITNHTLWLNANYYTPVDETFMTTGEIAPVAGTPMDFTSPKKIGAEIGADFEQLKFGRGYDHNWVLNTKGCMRCPVARLTCPDTGIKMEVYTNEPGIQVYTGNFLDGSVNGKDGKPANFRTAVCLETQHFPDSPNKSHLEGWYSCELNPGEEYVSCCIYQFSLCKGKRKGEGCDKIKVCNPDKAEGGDCCGKKE
jgi:aldose 1-epimerase